jgi:predicted PurR-regulated permease PerM
LKRFALAVVIVLAILSAAVVVWRLSGIVILLLASLAIAAVARAPIEYLIQRDIPRRLAIIMVYVIGGGLAAGVAYIVVVRISRELATLPDELITYYPRLQDLWPDALASRVVTADQLGTLFGDWRQANLDTIVTRAASGTGKVLAQLALSVILSLYWMTDRIRFERLWLSFLPPANRTRAHMIWQSVEAGVGAYIRSELLQMLLAGMLLAIGFVLLGLRSPILWAFVGAIAWSIPLIGVLLAIVPLALIIWLEAGSVTALAAVALTLVVFAVMEFGVERRVSNHNRYTRVLVILVMLAMADLFGLIGVVLAPPVAVALSLLSGELLTNNGATGVAVDEIEDFDVLQSQLESVSALVGNAPGPDTRLVNLSERLGQLLQQAQQAAEQQS